MSPTVLVQADNTWRTLATALAVGLRGGMVAVLSSHAVAAEFELAMEDIAPDAVVAADDVLAHWEVSSEAFPDKRAALDGWALVALRAPGQRRRPMGRRRRRRDDLGLDRPRQVRRAVRGLAAVRRPLHHRRDRAGARRRCRCLRPALVGGGVLLRDVPAGDARRSDGVHRVVAPRRRPGGDGRARRPLDDAGADDGPAALGPAHGRRPALRSPSDDRRRRPHGRRRPGSRRGGARHEVDPGLRHVRVPRPHDHPPRRGRRDEAGLRRPAVPRHGGSRRGRGGAAASRG